jgi:2,3-bisphosphoglycerate-independent phosphoglycerate mutase
MKYALVIPDGAADLPVDELKGRTPLEAARKPHMDWIAAHGRCGSVRTIPPGMPCGSDVAILSLLGYDPKACYPGRAPLEAAAQGIQLGPDEWVFRCNLVTLVDGLMEDYSAGHITSMEAGTLIDELQRALGGPGVTFHKGVSYRHLLVLKGGFNVKTTPPHDILSKPTAANLPSGAGADLLRLLMERSGAVLENHEVNKVRRDLGENPATHIWLWGQGQMPQLPSFGERFKIQGTAITAVDLVRGISRLIGWPVIEVPGATGYVDTNYAGKGAAAVKALDDVDLVCVHVEAPDEAGHNADVKAKLHAIEQIDQHVVGPLLERLQQEKAGWRILVLPDHPTPVSLRTHTPEPVPFAIAGERIEGVVAAPFNEKTAAASDLHIERGHELMEFFLKVR